MIMQLLQHNQQEYNRYYRRLLCVNLCRTIIFQSNSMQPHQQNTSHTLLVELMGIAPMS